MIKKITNKREEKNVITHLKVDGETKTRKEVFDDLLNTEYFTYPNGLTGEKGAKVYRVKTWISTNANESKKDNLDELPSF